MTNKLWIPVLIAAATLSASALAYDGDHRDRGWQEQRHEQWRDEQRYEHRHAHWRHDYRQPYYAYDYEYRPAPRYYDAPPAVYLPLPLLPPPPHEVLREILRGHR